MARLHDKVVLITGATGIAAATKKLAIEEGATVFVASLVGGDFTGDLSDAAAAESAVAECVTRHSRLDAVFHVAGISGRRFGDGPVHECSEEGWDEVILNNLRATFLVSRAAVRQMLKQQPASGTILLMSSVLADSPEPERFATHAYAASKGGVVALARSMAAYYATRGIRVNAIAPGLTSTPMSERAQSDPAIVEFMKRKQPLAGGMLDAIAIAQAAVFLLSDDARHITGQVMTVDAGWSLS